jgi:hypothetical protein
LVRSSGLCAHGSIATIAGLSGSRPKSAMAAASSSEPDQPSSMLPAAHAIKARRAALRSLTGEHSVVAALLPKAVQLGREQ